LRFLYLSPASRQALNGMRILAGVPNRDPRTLVSVIAQAAGLPANALAKIFQRLARFGLLTSRRGPGGGYALARSARDITLADILRAVQDIVPGGRHCLLGNERCGEGRLCLVHDVIIHADKLVIDGLSKITLAEFAHSKGWTKEKKA
jgi:Rrf2 family iron-sulfur cluster assembly transcriptional regulator